MSGRCPVPAASRDLHAALAPVFEPYEFERKDRAQRGAPHGGVLVGFETDHVGVAIEEAVQHVGPGTSHRRDAAVRSEQVAGALTPVPGGVGPLTIAMLLKNTVRAAHDRLNAR